MFYNEVINSNKYFLIHELQLYYPIKRDNCLDELLSHKAVVEWVLLRKDVILKQLCFNRKMTWTQGIGQKDVLTPSEFAIRLNSELRIFQNSQTILPVPLEEINWTSKCYFGHYVNQELVLPTCIQEFLVNWDITCTCRFTKSTSALWNLLSSYMFRNLQLNKRFFCKCELSQLINNSEN